MMLPLRVDAGLVSNPKYVELPNGYRVVSSRSGEYGEYDLYFIFDTDGFYIMECGSRDGVTVIDSNGSLVSAGYSSYYYTKMYESGCGLSTNGREWNGGLYFKYGVNFCGAYVINSPADFDNLAMEGSNGYYVLYDTETPYTQAQTFFQAPRVPGALEKNLTTTLQTMEVDPLTEVVKILPIGLVCLVGWIGLRKGLSLLRQVLFPA